MGQKYILPAAYWIVLHTTWGALETTVGLWGIAVPKTQCSLFLLGKEA